MSTAMKSLDSFIHSSAQHQDRRRPDGGLPRIWFDPSSIDWLSKIPPALWTKRL